MSFILPDTNLLTAIVGTSGSIDLTKVGVSAGGVSANPSLLKNPASVSLLNESSCTLQITFDQSGQGFTLPGGGWTSSPIPPGASKINWIVTGFNGNRLASTLHATYFMPGEQSSVPQYGSQSTLGAQNNIFIDTQNIAGGVTLTYTALVATQRIYLLGFDLTGDKAAATNTGLITIQSLVNPINGNTYNDLKYYINQTTLGTTPLQERFPFQACSALGGTITILNPNMSAAVWLVVFYQIY